MNLAAVRHQGWQPDLYGWGDIATLFNCSVDTARRWAKDHAMPVRKTPYDRVVARRDEILDWYERQFTRRLPRPK